MNISRRVLALVCLAFAAPAPAADLKKIERTIAKEPAYQTKSPKYCLLVFGPEARVRAWLVHDGEVLYVDRNCNGDLTEQGEAVAGSRTDEGILFRVGEITEPGEKTKHALNNVTLSGQIARLKIRVDGKRLQIIDSIPDGDLALASRPQDAPVIHLNGPLTFALAAPEALVRKDKDASIAVVLGTPGLGRGSFAYVLYEDETIPNSPVAAIDFPNRIAGADPIRANVRFKRRP